MTSLGKELQDTIRNLEKIRDSDKTHTNDINIRLDKLYAQQIELINAAINNASDDYAKAANAMSDAQKKTKEAINDLTKLEDAVKKVAAAVELVTKLLSKLA